MIRTLKEAVRQMWTLYKRHEAQTHLNLARLEARVETLELRATTLRLAVEDLQEAVNALERVADPLLIQFGEVDVMHNMAIPVADSYARATYGARRENQD